MQSRDVLSCRTRRVTTLTISSRYEVLRETFWNPSVWAIDGLYGVVSFLLFIRDNFLSESWKQHLGLLDLVHKLPWWGWLIIFLSINILLLFEGATRTIHDRERKIDQLTSELDRIENSGPRIRPHGSDAAHVLQVYFSPPQFTAPFLRVRFANDPDSSAVSAVARNVGAKVRYFVDGATSASLELDGRWSDSTQPSARDPRVSRTDLLRTDFHLGDEHIVDIGFKDPDTGTFFAWSNESYSPPGFRRPDHRLSGDTIRAEVRLRAVGVDETFTFRFAVNPELRVLEQPGE